MMSETISKTLLRQRVRNRLIEYFDFVSSLDNIARVGAFEVINRWDDWIGSDPKSNFFSEPVFSELEQAATRRVHAMWNHCAEQTDDDIFDVQLLSERACWCGLSDAAGSALRLFAQRGRLSEDEEAF